MANCDLCSAPIAADSKRYSADQMRIAAVSGLSPSGPMTGLPAASGSSQQEAFAGWLQMVAAQTTDWLICPACSVGVDDCLARGLLAAPGGPSTKEAGWLEKQFADEDQFFQLIAFSFILGFIAWIPALIGVKTFKDPRAKRHARIVLIVSLVVTAAIAIGVAAQIIRLL